MTVLRKYIRDEKRRPIGLLIAYVDGNTVRIGFSKCNTKYDTFDKKLANHIALNRAMKGTRKTWDDIPFEVRNEIPNFADRCKRYFKDKFRIDIMSSAEIHNDGV